MSRADRARWARARTLGDLGELTAQWLEGRIRVMPGYGPIGHEDETQPLVGVLAEANRAGFVTSASQPGSLAWGVKQRAAVEGFAGTAVAAELVRAADGAGLLWVAQKASWWRFSYRESVTVTLDGGKPFTSFGDRLPRRFIVDPHLGFGMCHWSVKRILCRAYQVTLVDPEWGRNDRLWPVLAAFARGEYQ